MKIRKLIIGILISLIFVSCDCWVLINGKLVDQKTKEPIENACLEFKNVKCDEQISSTVATEMVNCIFRTDSTGMFFMKSDSYGICPRNPIKIKIRKSGYKTKEIEFNKGYIISDLILELEKEQKP